MKNMNKNSTYSLDLAQEELYWLAGAFGVANLPLPDDTWHGYSAHAYDVDLQKGNASLLARGLLRSSPGFGWRVDRLPLGIIQSLSSANSLLRVKYIQQNGITRTAHFFTMGENALSIEIDADAVHFTLYQTHVAMREAVLNWKNFPHSATKAGATYQLPQPDAFLPIAWKTPALIEKMLNPLRLFAEIKDISTWVKSLEYLVLMSNVHIEGQSKRTVGQISVCGNTENIWGGALENEIVSFVPVLKNDLAGITDQMIAIIGNEK
ncbi:MAG: hypothetical protein HN916_17160 [Anaerolineae bacterium]|jgi:hypothetical protein|nr:hypothetical protein [Anaerolineae bacterium]